MVLEELFTIGGNESVVFSGQLLDEFLILVQLLQIVWEIISFQGLTEDLDAKI